MEQPKIRFENDFNIKLIYLRFRGSYTEFRKNAKSMYERLLQYATEHGIYKEGVNMVMTIYHDNPYLTKAKDLRTSVAMTVPNSLTHIDDDEITLMTVSGSYAIGRFEIKISEYDRAWNYMYHEWLFKSNVQPRDSFPFEMYITKPPKNFKETSITDIYIPIIWNQNE
jgi:AraC family transcriptional regulator